MAVTRTFNRLLTFLQEHERVIGAGLFVLGFLTDLLTFGLLPVETVNWFFITYLTLAAVTVFGATLVSSFKPRDSWWRKSLAVLFPLGAQYAFGGIFSGFVVFYARSSVFSVSWPFLLLLVLFYFGNEYFRTHKSHLVFQTVLFFFALYTYAIFALPFFIGKIGPLTFLGSTALALIGFGLFLGLLWLVNRDRLKEFIKHIVSATSAITLAVCIAYFTGLIPPLPLALVEEGVFHSLTKVPGGYAVKTEGPEPWWHIGPPEVSYTGGTLYVYSAVRAPISFSSAIVHRWEHYVPGRGWVAEGKVSFGLSGGRAEGYRGYSEKGGLAPGKWRVSVETPGGQVIGRMRFDVKSTDTMPVLFDEMR